MDPTWADVGSCRAFFRGVFFVFLFVFFRGVFFGAFFWGVFLPGVQNLQDIVPFSDINHGKDVMRLLMSYSRLLFSTPAMFI